ncbi:hypothetical protein CYMTET_12304 [Cymbomonas tetramitiformis]|uniref:Polycystin cation channel PKD1/PKD2 domain-containing protein n=1 Tax=Cymbomonas tetramitiformis TaxID=36881 RepID=A0AAE0GKJ2_9CHLO|nr:hypothetical protein CYMTET_12304 [Cymbomonas tetramitiformis]
MMVTVLTPCPSPSYACPDTAPVVCASCVVDAANAAKISCLCLAAVDTEAEAAAVEEYVPPEDITAPVITLVTGDGQAALTSSGTFIVIHRLYVGAVWAQPGFSAADDIDGDLTAMVTHYGNSAVSTAAATEDDAPFVVQYNVADAAGNVAATVRRRVYVEDPCADIGEVLCNYDTGSCSENGLCAGLGLDEEEGEGAPATPPILSLVGAEVVTVSEGQTYVACSTDSPLDAVCDSGALASDTLDGDLTASVTACATEEAANRFNVRGVTGCGVDAASPPGVYHLTFAVSNSAGLTATAQRQLVVTSSCPVGEVLCSDLVNCSEQGVCLADVAGTSTQLEVAANTAPNITVLQLSPVLDYVQLKQHSSYKPCGWDEVPTTEFMCDPGVEASDAEDGNLTAEVLACPPVCITAKDCEGHQLSRKGLAGCLDTSAEVGTVFAVEFVVYDHSSPSLLSTAYRYITIVSACDVGETWCDGECSPVSCEDRVSLVSLMQSRRRHRQLSRRLHTVSISGAENVTSPEELLWAELEKLQSSSTELSSALGLVEGTVRDSGGDSEVWATELLDLWVSKMKGEVSNVQNLSVSVQQALDNADAFIAALEVRSASLAAVEASMAEASDAQTEFLLATEAASQQLVDLVAGDGNAAPILDISPPPPLAPPPPAYCEINLEPRSYSFDVPSVQPNAVTGAVITEPVPAPFDSSSTPSNSSPPPSPTPSDSSPPLPSSFWPDLSSPPNLADGTRRHLLRRGGGGGGGKGKDATADGVAISGGTLDLTGEESELSTITLDGDFKVPTYLVRGSNRVVGGMLLVLHRVPGIHNLRQLAAMDLQCTKRFEHLRAPCKKMKERESAPADENAIRFGFDTVFAPGSTLYDAAVVERAELYYNLSNVNQVRAPGRKPYFPYPFIERTGAGLDTDAYPLWIDASLISDRAEQLNVLLNEGNYIDSATMRLTGTVVTYQATEGVFMLQQMDFSWTESGTITAEYATSTIPVRKGRWTVSEGWDAATVLILLYSLAVLFKGSHAFAEWLVELRRSSRRLGFITVANLQQNLHEVGLWGVQLCGVMAWYIYQEKSLTLEVPMTYAVLDDLYSAGNFLMPSKKESSAADVAAADLVDDGLGGKVAPRWLLENDDSGLQGYLDTLSRLQELDNWHKGYCALQCVVCAMLIWESLLSVGFHKRLDFVRATLSTCAGDLGSFFFTMAILCIQFAMCGHILYGDRFEEYHSASGSIFNMFVFIIAGDWGLINPVFYPGKLGYEYSPLEWVVVWIYIQSNILITFLTLLNMLMAILGDAQGEVKEAFVGHMSRKAGGLFTADDDGLYEAPGFFKEALEMMLHRPPPTKVVEMFTTLVQQCEEEDAASPKKKPSWATLRSIVTSGNAVTVREYQPWPACHPESVAGSPAASLAPCD